jgi:hypothetical protein
MSALFCNGCSMLIASSGKDLSQLKTRDEVREQFGEPMMSCNEEGRDFDDFRSHRKIAYQLRTAGYSMSLAMTLGLGEFITFPYEVYETGKDVIVGQDVRFYYDENGRTTECLVNGDRPYNWSLIISDEQLSKDQPSTPSTNRLQGGTASINVLP